jgi:hypothetical protein
MKQTIANLPPSVTRYLAAANKFDVRVAGDCFTPDATVHDEHRDYVGHFAVRAWIADTIQKYQPALTVMRAFVHGDDVSLAVAVSGQFPGSPVTLDYELRLRDGKISVLTIA